MIEGKGAGGPSEPGYATVLLEWGKRTDSAMQLMRISCMAESVYPTLTMTLSLVLVLSRPKTKHFSRVV